MTDVDWKSTPVTPSERIQSIDVLRGFAVLGILIMNVQSFAMIQAAYINPTTFGDLTGINRLVWILSHVLADQKFMSIFSILFGAGVLLFTMRAEEKGFRSGRLHYRRSLWLMLFGILHAYLLWYGDILFTYGLCALLAYLFRKVRPGRLVIIALAVIAVPSLLFAFFGWSIQFWPEEAYQQNITQWSPTAEQIDEEVMALRGGWLDQMSERLTAAIATQTFIFLIWYGWRAGGLMLLGMALLKWGVLSAERSRRLYLSLVGLWLVIGLPLIIGGVITNSANEWTYDYSMFFGWQFNYWGSLFAALGYIGVVMLVSKSGWFSGLKRRLASVGRMAFTNYLMQTVICTTIFYGHGFGLFGKLERWEQVLVVLGVWVFQLVVSPMWLRYFRFGPTEWLWRSLTYLKLQPMRYSSPNTSTQGA
jgi:uncharacterized protein